MITLGSQIIAISPPWVRQERRVHVRPVFRTAVIASLLTATLTAGATAASAVSAEVSVGGGGAQGAAVNSPGIASGNVVQVPVQVPVNACGNTINIVGLLNPTFGNTCVNY
ncbi:chaplin [Planomonospora sp. ID67723]|nr:chaplin [Planomonospora sp. ID67723]